MIIGAGGLALVYATPPAVTAATKSSARAKYHLALKACKHKDRTSKSRRVACEKAAKVVYERELRSAGKVHPPTVTGAIPTTSNGQTGAEPPGNGATGTLTGTTGGTATTGTGITKGTGPTELQVLWEPPEFVPLSFTLDCEPAAGTLINPAGACAEIAANPANMVLEPTGLSNCTEETNDILVSGVYHGQPAHASFHCAHGNMGGWGPFLPLKQAEAVGTDSGFGPFTLGVGEQTVTGLLAGDEALGRAGGLDVYKPTGGLRGTVSRNCTGGRSDHLVMAFRYTRADGLVTVMANLQGESLEGQSLREAETRCEGEHEGPPRVEGFLANWYPVACGGRRAWADHPLSEGPTARATTIVIPALLPLVIITSEPASACEDAARLNGEWGA